MDSGFSATELRVIIALIGAVIFALIYFFGRPKKPRQGRRTPPVRGETNASGERIEPTFGDPDRLADEDGNVDPLEPGMQEELERLGSEIAAQRAETADKKPMPGVRPEQAIERIVTLFVAARPGELIP